MSISIKMNTDALPLADVPTPPLESLELPTLKIIRRTSPETGKREWWIVSSDPTDTDAGPYDSRTGEIEEDLAGLVKFHESFRKFYARRRKPPDNN